MQSPADPLRMHAPNPVIERIFARLHLTYGSMWLQAYEGLDAAMVAADWNLQLQRFASPRGLSAIATVLENLPSGWPPTSVKFRDMVFAAMPREEARAALPAPDVKPDPERCRAVREALAGVGSGPVVPGAWVDRLKAMADSGARLTQHQREVLREMASRGEAANAGQPPEVSS